MTDFLTRLDSADPASVPGLCLLYADYLSERGEPCDGWRALGMLGKVPTRSVYMWNNGYGVDEPDECTLPAAWYYADVGRWYWRRRSEALAAAAQAFEGLADEVKREILNSATANT